MENARTQSWAKAASAVVIGVGLVLAAAAWPPLAAPVALLTDLVIWPLDGMQTLAAPETRMFAAIAGGVMVGWGVTLWTMAAHVLPADLPAARSIALSGIYTWFVVDSLGSIAAGASLNGVINIGFVVLFLYAFRQPSATAVPD
ncbi:hypothetical protein [Hoeflea sp.]|uniref:hypothetical protein n=1 Tax=Hoeflea sp. TaxID=1940281 RepID=UPI00198F0635|nr:hypothetical protein [Hoeflea sp.]MBC7281852.1 hypothetical protein [Hoeflea sp.]